MEWIAANWFFILILLFCVGIHMFRHGHHGGHGAGGHGGHAGHNNHEGCGHHGSHTQELHSDDEH